MTENALIEFYENNAEILAGNNAIISGIRGIGWWFLKTVFVPLADGAKSLFDYSFGLVDLTQIESVNNFITSFKPVFIGCMALSLFALGIMLIFYHEKKPKIAQNILLAILCVTCSTVVFQQLNQFTLDIKSGIDEISIAGEDSSSEDVYSILSENMIDLYQLDSVYGLSNVNYSENENITHPKITKENISYIGYTEVLDPAEERYEWKDTDVEDILSNKLIMGADGESEITEIYNGVLWTSAGNNFYYRYTLNSLPLIINLVTLIILYIALAYKCLRLIFELVFGRLMAYVFSAELSGGQRLSKILVFIRDTYIALLLTVCCEKLYYVLSAGISSLKLPTLVEAILLLFLAFSVIDGPNLAEKVLGIDIGLSSSWGRVMAFSRAGSAAARTITQPEKALGHWLYQNHKDKKLAERMNGGAKGTFAAASGTKADKNGTGFMGNAKDESNSGTMKDSDNFAFGSDRPKNKNAESGSVGQDKRGGRQHNAMQGESGKADNTSFMDADPAANKDDFKMQAGEENRMEKSPQSFMPEEEKKNDTDFMNDDIGDAKSFDFDDRKENQRGKEASAYRADFMKDDRINTQGEKSSLRRKPTQYAGNILKKDEQNGFFATKEGKNERLRGRKKKEDKYE